MLRFLRARGAGEEAEDLLQELWVKARSAHDRPISDPLAYLYRVADRQMIDQRRSALRRLRREEEWSTPGGWGSGEHGQSGERHLLARDQLRTAEAVLAGLGERTDRIFRRFRIEGVAQHEIASEMGISISAVEKHLQKAYRALLSVRDEVDGD